MDGLGIADGDGVEASLIEGHKGAVDDGFFGKVGFEFEAIFFLDTFGEAGLMDFLEVYPEIGELGIGSSAADGFVGGDALGPE